MTREFFKVPSLPRLAILVFFIVPMLAWAVVGPVRVVLPEVGVSVNCVNASVCVDDPSKVDSAMTLYAEALAFVSQHVGAVEGSPKVIFCSTQPCADHFGLGARSAVTVGKWGSVIGPNAWKAYYVRHELIHYEQYQHLGVIQVLRSPEWFVEGMAYGLSEDPRHPLNAPFESHREKFLSWYRGVQKDRMWEQAADLQR